MKSNSNKNSLNRKNYEKSAISTVYDFSKKMIDEFGDLIKAIVLFGSQTGDDKDKNPNSDIDVLVVVDDAKYTISYELSQSYRILTGNIVSKVSDKIHVTTMKLTHFWEYARSGDPVIINILRSGYSIYDAGFFEPMQFLLFKGRIRPTEEAVYSYFERAPRNLKNVDYNLLKCVSDLYWAVMDSAHAALMKIGEEPPSPRKIPQMIHEKLVKPGVIDSKHHDTAQEIYDLSKKIAHQEIKVIEGKKIDELKKKIEDFVEKMKEISID